MSAVPSRDLGQRLANKPTLPSRDVVLSQAALEVFVMDRLVAGTGQQRYRELAQKARSWFDGRNPAQVVIYDRAIGRVADGLDDGRLNDRSWAEANISAAWPIR